MRRKMTDEEKANKQLKLTIKMYLQNRDKKQKQHAKTIDMPLATFNEKWHDPGRFRRSELMMIFAVLNVRQEDKEKIPW